MSLQVMESIQSKIIPKQLRDKRFVFLICCLVLTMDNFNVAGGIGVEPSIQKLLNTTSINASWVLSAYSLTLGSFIIFSGKLGDILGVHNVFIIGTFFMALFSLLCAVVPNSVIAVIIFRAFQGIAAAMIMPNGMALAAHYFQGKQLLHAIQGLGIVLTASFGLGLIVGSAFDLTKQGYKGYFYFTFAFSLFLGILLVFIIIPVERTEAHKNMKLKNLDFFGVFLLVVGLLLAIFGFTEAGNTWRSPKVYVTIPVGFCLLVLLFLFEDVYLKIYKQKHQNEEKSKSDWRANIQVLFPVEVFRILNFFPYFVSVFCVYFTFMTGLTGSFQYNIHMEGDSLILSAVKVFPLGAGLCIACLVYPHSLPKKLGTRNFLLIMHAIVMVSSIWIARTDYKYKNSYWRFQFFSLFLMGVGTNWFFMTYLNHVLVDTPLHLQALVSGIFQTSGQISVSISGAIISTVLGSLPEGEFEDKSKSLSKFRNVYYIGIAFGILFFLCAFFVKDAEPEQLLEKPEHTTVYETENQSECNKSVTKKSVLTELQEVSNSIV